MMRKHVCRINSQRLVLAPQVARWRAYEAAALRFEAHKQSVLKRQAVYLRRRVQAVDAETAARDAQKARAGEAVEQAVRELQSCEESRVTAQASANEAIAAHRTALRLAEGNALALARTRVRADAARERDAANHPKPGRALQKLLEDEAGLRYACRVDLDMQLT